MKTWKCSGSKECSSVGCPRSFLHQCEEHAECDSGGQCVPVCSWCELPLVKKPQESAEYFRLREHCDAECAASHVHSRISHKKTGAELQVLETYWRKLIKLRKALDRADPRPGRRRR